MGLSSNPVLQAKVRSAAERYHAAIVGDLGTLKEITRAGAKGQPPLGGHLLTLARLGRKAAEDIQASLDLLARSLLGPAAVLTRACREAVLTILYIALAPASEREDFHRYYKTTKPAIERKRMRGVRRKIVEQFGGQISKSLRDYLDAPVGTDQDSLEDEATIAAHKSYQYPSAQVMVLRIAAWSSVLPVADLEVFLVQGVDYWLECEAVHSGADFLALYAIPRNNLGREPDTEPHLLSRLRDLDDLLTLACVALLQGFNILGTMPMPPSFRARQGARAAEQAVWAELMGSGLVLPPGPPSLPPPPLSLLP